LRRCCPCFPFRKRRSLLPFPPHRRYSSDWRLWGNKITGITTFIQFIHLVLTDIFDFLQKVVVWSQAWEIFWSFVESTCNHSSVRLVAQCLCCTYTLATRFRIRTSFSTVRSSKIWDMNWFRLKTNWQMGHGAGPEPNKRSIQDSHLIKP
jgi:hypothetical protein